MWALRKMLLLTEAGRAEPVGLEASRLLMIGGLPPSVMVNILAECWSSSPGAPPISGDVLSSLLSVNESRKSARGPSGSTWSYMEYLPGRCEPKATLVMLHSSFFDADSFDGGT